MHRQYQRLLRAADQNASPGEHHEPQNARDILYQFCCDAFYLEDWIRKSPLKKSTKRDAWKLFQYARYSTTASLALAACADIANTVKHHRLNEPGFVSGQPGQYAEIIGQSQGATLPVTLPFHFAANRWIIQTPDNPTGPSATHDALHLAHQAVADWDTWLNNHTVPLPSL